MKNSKGFTLLELIVVIAIMGVLAMVSVPILTQYINRSEVGVCEANRQEFLHSFIVYQSSGDNTGSLEQAIAGTIPEMLTDKNNLKCPSGGTYSVVNGSIVCSVHGAIGSSGSGSGSGSTTLKAGDTILSNIVLDDLGVLCVSAINPSNGIRVVQGQVYITKEGVTYAVGWNDWISKSDAQKFIDSGIVPSNFIKIDKNVTINSSNYLGGSAWNPPLKKFIIFYENNASYAFVGDDGAYDLKPTQGGNWIKLS